MTEREHDRPKGIDDLTPAEFVAQLIGGAGRWIFTVLAALSLIYFALPYLNPESSDFSLLGLSPGTERLLVSAVGIVWCALAVVNWRNWLRRRA